MAFDVSDDVTYCSVITLQGNDSAEREGPSKRGRSNPYVRMGAKASRERMRREKLNDRFLELSAVLEPENPVKTEKLAILVDAIRSLKQLKAESHKYVEMNTKLSEEIKNLKAEKIELREEKLTLKADKERIEQHLKSMFVPPTGFMPGNSAVFQVEAKKMQMIPSYGFVPMWHYLPPLTQDTSQDHQLRPPAA
ncbi:basic helix-loop-helix (bHLH) DNA-bindingsuperfamily protein [Striga asiatica]|uniref:Basic helix-loop-helix (BHLH) DNA-bindingsuperfamily protein n=1 Tax=Striga asiatica TaxID=4170 RepID=A0A5A7R4P7_STRAF|nr:basic helix-loop-helix (bHLH) DNA-bindingsuperfamily protein [Striga asiatica]